MPDVVDNAVTVSSSERELVLAYRDDGDLVELASRAAPARGTISGGLTDAE